MKNKPRTRILLSAMALAAASAAGCIGVSAEEDPVNLVFLRAGTEENKKMAFTELLNGFMEEYPNITVEYQEAPWGNDFETKLNTGFASGTAADVINYSLASIGARVPLGQYENLNEYVEGWEGMDEILFNTPEAIEAMEYLKQLYDIGLVAYDNSQSDQNPFRNGTAGMTIISANEFSSANTGDLEGKIKMVPMFAKEKEATFCGVHFMFMNSNSTKKEAAWKLIEYLTRKESMQKYCEIVGNTPVRVSLSDWYLENNDESAAIVLKSVEIGKGSPKVPYFQTLFNIVDEAMERVFYETASVEDALNEAAEELQEEIENQ